MASISSMEGNTHDSGEDSELDVLRSVKRPPCSLCENDLDDSESIWYCGKCDATICINCATCHNVGEHSVIRDGFPRRQTFKKCAIHDSEFEKRWCSSCEKMTCAKCEVQVHKFCLKKKAVKNAYDVWHQKGSDLLGVYAGCKKAINYVLSSIESLDETAEERRQTEQDTLALVKDTKERIMNDVKVALDREEMKFIEIVKNHFSQEEQQTAIIKKELICDLGKINKLSDECIKFLSGSAHDVIMTPTENIKKKFVQAAGSTNSSELPGPAYLSPKFIVRRRVSDNISYNIKDLCTDFAHSAIGDIVLERKYHEISEPLHEIPIGKFVPWHLDVDDTCIYLTDKDTSEVRAYSFGGQELRRFGRGVLHVPADIAASQTHDLLYVCDLGNHRIQVLGKSGGVVSTISRKSIGGKYNIAHPFSICLTKDEKIIVADDQKHSIHIIDPNTHKIVTSFGENGKKPGNLNRPARVAFDSCNQLIIVSDQGNNRIETFDMNGNFVSMFGQNGRGLYDIEIPSGLAVDGFGNIIVVDHGNDRLKFYDSNRKLFHKVQIKNCKPIGIALRHDCKVVLTTQKNNFIKIY